MTWQGKAVVITGASGGIGAALAKELAARGAQVGVLARRAEWLQKLVDEVRAAGGRIEAEMGDVTDRIALGEAVAGDRPRLRRAIRRSRIFVQMVRKSAQSVDERPMCPISTMRAFSSRTSSRRPARINLSASASDMAPFSWAGISRRSASVGSNSKTPPP